MKTVKIGTRGSQLALYQAYQVKEHLERKFSEYNFEIVIIHTKGDKILDVALSKIGDKGLFTKELEVALIEKEIDMAVHSLKDLPTKLPDGLILGGVLERGEVRDALVSMNGKKLADLDETDIVGTSSLRRASQLLHINKKIKIVDMRGNVNTRLQKMESGYCTATFLAGAGLIRLGMADRITELLDPQVIIPAASQGIMSIETRDGDEFISGLMAQITHKETAIAADAERSFLRVLEGGCQVPMGCHTRLENGDFHINGFIADLKGDKIVKKYMSSSVAQANDTAAELAGFLLENGGSEILKGIK